MNTGKLNPFIETVNFLFQFFVLNLVFLITCIPVFTIGTALASLYYVMFKEIKGEYGYVVRTYLREFKRNFKTGTIAFLMLLGVGGVLLFNLLFWPVQGTRLSAAVTGLLVILAVIWLTVSHYTYPLIGRFVNTSVNAVKNACGLALRNFKKTLMMLVLDVCVICFLMFCSIKTLMIVLPVCGVVLPVYLRSRMLLEVFAPYEE